VTRVGVDLDRLAELMVRMERCERQLVRTHEDVTQRVREMYGSWDGDAAQAQAAAQREWSAAAAQVHAALAGLRRIGSTAHANYLAAIAANRRMWAQ
jgi:ESAT-6 family protein